MVLVIVTTYPPKGVLHPETGGVASYSRNLATAIAQTAENIEVHIVCDRSGQPTKYQEDGVTVHRVFKRNPSFVWQVSKYVKRLNPDVIHIQQELSLFGNVVTAYALHWLLRLFKPKPVVITLHGVVALNAINEDFVQQNNVNLPVRLVKQAFLKIYKPLCKYATSIIVHEKPFADVLAKDYRATRHKIKAIPHGVEAVNKISRSLARKKLSLKQSTKVILFMGYLTGYKGIDLLIEGYAKFSRRSQDSFLIIGAGRHPKLKNNKTYLQNSYQKLQAQAASSIVKNRYQWVGFIKEADIINYYSAADIAVYPYTISMSSSGPMALAIGYGLAFIASDAFRGFLPDSLLFSRHSNDLAEALDRYFKNPGEVLAVTQNLRRGRLWSQVAQQHLKVYHAAVR